MCSNIRGCLECLFLVCVVFVNSRILHSRLTARIINLNYTDNYDVAKIKMKLVTDHQ